MVASIANIAEYEMNMNKQVEYREGASVEVSNTPTVEVSSRAAERTTVKVGNVEARVEGGESLPVEVGRVSLYNSAHSARSVEDIDIISFFTSNRYKDLISKLRATTDPDTRRVLKEKQLPAITTAGVFHPKRGNQYIRSYSGMLCIDIDGKENPAIEDWSATAHRIGSLSPCVLYAGLSAGGNGCFVVYRIATPHRYAEHLATITAELMGAGLMADTACKDLARLRFASYDPAPYLNTEAIPHVAPVMVEQSPNKGANEAHIKPQRPQADQAPAASLNANNRGYFDSDHSQHLNRPTSTGRLSLARVEAAVAELVRRGINIAEHYVDWWRIGCALASTYGEQARPLYHAISAQSTKYRASECDAQYKRCMNSHSIGIASLLYYFKGVGIGW